MHHRVERSAADSGTIIGLFNRYRGTEKRSQYQRLSVATRHPTLIATAGSCTGSDVSLALSRCGQTGGMCRPASPCAELVDAFVRCVLLWRSVTIYTHRFYGTPSSFLKLRRHLICTRGLPIRHNCWRLGDRRTAFANTLSEPGH